MSLPVLVAMVAVGISMAVLAVHWTGGSRLALLASEQQARARFADDHPDESVSAVYITADAADAMLVLDGGRIGIVHRVGDRFLTRIVAAGDRPEPVIDGRSLILHLDDFTWRGGTFVFADDVAPRAVAETLRPLSAATT